ncbi:MAG: hypothetical protein RL521_631 [Bacteroidota bacterium]
MRYSLVLLFLVAVMQSCVAPRSVLNSGKVTPKDNFAAGWQYAGNVSTAPLQKATELVDLNIDQIASAQNMLDTLTAADAELLNQNLEIIGQAAIAYAADPIGAGSQFYLRYGLVDRVDIGYKYASGAHVFDAQYQFLGPVGNVEDITDERWYGSVGVQYAGQKVSIPAWATPLQNAINFDFSRRDVMVPITFSYSFGNEEEYGAIALGLVGNYTRFKYSTFNTDFAQYINPDGSVNVLAIQAVDQKSDIFAYGGFVNLKLGYKYVYVLPALSFYYQDYGQFQNVIGSSFHLKGWTFVPSIGIRARIGKSTRNK